jgi:hypothetical protein
MNEQDKKLAKAALERLCKGAQIGGIRFGPVLQILIGDSDYEGKPLKGQVYLNLSSSWRVFETRPASFPNGEDELSEASQDEQIQAIVSIRERVIRKVELGENEQHLILTLDDEQVIFVNGKHDRYECWDMGVAFDGNEETWLVVACPGGGIAIWTPKNFVI